MSNADVPEESSRRSVQQLKNSVGRSQFWCEESACRGVQQNGGVPDQRCLKPACMLGQCNVPLPIPLVAVCDLARLLSTERWLVQYHWAIFITCKLVSSLARSFLELAALLNSASLPRRDTSRIYREYLFFSGQVIGFNVA